MDSQSRPLIRPLAGYRVMARHCDQSRSLVTLAQNPRAARILAKAFCDVIERSGRTASREFRSKSGLALLPKASGNG